MTKQKGTSSKRKSRKQVKTLTQRDDIPARPIHTYCTASCVLPKVSDMTIVRTLGHATIVSTTSQVNLQINFSLAQTGISSGTQWDQYKILAIRQTVVPDQNAIGLFTNSTTSIPPLYWVLDYDDSNTLTNYAAAEAYSNCLVLGAGESAERTFRPRLAVGAYTGSVFTGFLNLADNWIDAASTGVLHYGSKFVVPGATAMQTQLPSWQISTEYFIAFRKSV
jgi:hypothetical protein